ncbi:MAG TPA: TonB-dependent receptor [Flavisolibacter sp.]
MGKASNAIFHKTSLFFLSFLLMLSAFAQNTTIRGTVKDPNGLPLQGASVTVEGTKRGVVTDANGNYSIPVTPGNYTVVITYVGMQQQKQTVNVPASGIADISFSMQSGGDLNRIVIVGSRSTAVRSSTQTVAPVDVISARDLQATGQIEPTQMLNMIAPSFNSSRQTIADGTDHIDPATLRGLGPDQVLVLVNGRRRYNTALLNVNGTIGRGSVGTDLNSIPPEAIERIEVLRDGASSQYGSDAIAGVVNIVLKKNTRGTTLYSHYGKFFAGDGENIQAGITQGVKLGTNGGFLTLSGDFRHRDATNRVGDYRGRVYLNDSIQDEQIIAQRGFSRKNNMFVGQSELKNYGFVANGGLPISSTTQIFFTGSMNWREGRGAGFYRYPSQTSQVISELYPNGFLPFINSEIKDKSAIVGIEGKMGRWNWDASQTAGGNSFSFNITNTNNASQFALGKNAQTEFEAGELKFYQYVTNVNFSRDYGTSMGLKSFNLAAGAELRFDNYQIVAGEEASYMNYAPTSGRVGGAQVFPGFQPANAVDETRTVAGVYADLETDLTDRLLANAAARFENYSDFGSNVAGKLALRYKITDAISIRGSFSNGFRAPSMHQRYFSSVATVFISNGTTLVPVQNGTFNNESVVAKAFGMPSLKAEKSLNYSTGITSRFAGFSLTVDGYIVKIKDRIVLTGSFTKSSPVVAQLLANYPEVNSAAFFTNAIDTRTKGVDIVLSRNARLGKATLTASLAANFNETEVTESRPLPDQLKSDPTLAEGVLFDREQRTRIERGQPRDKITLGLTYNIERFTVNSRVTRFGRVASADRLNPLLDESFDPRVVTDLSVGYRIGNFATLTIGANNIANVYPEKLEHYGNTSLGRFIYSRNATQFGFNGGYYYTSLIFDISNL